MRRKLNLSLTLDRPAVVTATHTRMHTQMRAHSYSVPIVWLAGSQTPTYINWLHNLFDSMVKAEFIRNPQRVCPSSCVCVCGSAQSNFPFDTRALKYFPSHLELIVQHMVAICRRPVHASLMLNWRSSSRSLETAIVSQLICLLGEVLTCPEADRLGK